MNKSNWTLEAETNTSNTLWVDSALLRNKPDAQRFLDVVRSRERVIHRDGMAGYEVPMCIPKSKLGLWLLRVGIAEQGSDYALETGIAGDGQPVLAFKESFIEDLVSALVSATVPSQLLIEYCEVGLLLATGSVQNIKWNWRIAELTALSPQALYAIFCAVALHLTDPLALAPFRANRGKDKLVESILTTPRVGYPEVELQHMGYGHFEGTAEGQWLWYTEKLHDASVKDLNRVLYFLETGIISEDYVLLNPDEEK